jgi:predicted transcriptional regulator
MATIEIPDALYEQMAELARRNKRTVAEQVIAELEIVEENRRRRREALDAIRQLPHITSSLDPVELIREDRDR